MSTFIVISMKTFAVLLRTENEEGAETMHTLNSPAHTVKDGDLSALGSADLLKIYNAQPGVKPVTRFADRKAAERRCLEALTAAPEVVIAQQQPEEIEEVKTKTKKTPVASKGKRGRKALDGATMKIELTAAGKKDDQRFHAESPRSQVFAIIKKAGEITLDALVKKVSFITAAQVRACVQKLKAKSYIKVTS